jgi:sulfatase maturation enzyme AslB (radical SAM superfamily)
MTFLNFIQNGFFKKRARDLSLLPLIEEYNQTRPAQNKQQFCKAPFSNLYFNTEGDVALCWQTFHRAEKYTEQKTLKDIWHGLNFERIREGIKNQNLDFGCTACKNHLLERNFTNILARAYDHDYPITKFPAIMEFELENTCNLACTMCNGMLSSTIRRDREKLPPMSSPYGEKFLNELNEFIPFLHEIRFNGGEPFLIKIYERIWDKVAELNPGLKMIVATNGTVLNSKVKQYLERGNFHFNISIDGITKESYEGIRVNGDFEKLMKNFIYFRDYCQNNQRTLCIMVNPLRQNWMDLAQFVNFANEHNVAIWFNTITKPAEQALWSLPAPNLERIYKTLSDAALDPFKGGSEGLYNFNLRVYNNLVHQQIKTWWIQALEHEKSNNSFSIDDDEPIKAKAEKKIYAYLIHRDEDRIMVAEKIAATAAIIDFELADAFYQNVLATNPETLVTFCKQYSANELKDFFLTTWLSKEKN